MDPTEILHALATDRILMAVHPSVLINSRLTLKIASLEVTTVFNRDISFQNELCSVYKFVFLLSSFLFIFWHLVLEKTNFLSII